MKSRAIGFRSGTETVFYSVIEINAKKEITILSVDKIQLPLALSVPERLRYLRNTMLDILKEYQVEYAGIRLTESVAKSVSVSRINNESVLQEMLASSNVKSYFTGQISRISGILNIDKSFFKQFIDETKKIPYHVPEWSTYCNELKEAVLTSIAAGKLA